MRRSTKLFLAGILLVESAQAYKGNDPSQLANKTDFQNQQNWNFAQSVLNRLQEPVCQRIGPQGVNPPNRQCAILQSYPRDPNTLSFKLKGAVGPCTPFWDEAKLKQQNGCTHKILEYTPKEMKTSGSRLITVEERAMTKLQARQMAQELSKSCCGGSAACEKAMTDVPFEFCTGSYDRPNQKDPCSTVTGLYVLNTAEHDYILTKTTPFDEKAVKRLIDSPQKKETPEEKLMRILIQENPDKKVIDAISNGEVFRKPDRRTKSQQFIENLSDGKGLPHTVMDLTGTWPIRGRIMIAPYATETERYNGVPTISHELAHACSSYVAQEKARAAPDLETHEVLRSGCYGGGSLNHFSDLYKNVGLDASMAECIEGVAIAMWTGEHNLRTCESLCPGGVHEEAFAEAVEILKTPPNVMNVINGSKHAYSPSLWPNDVCTHHRDESHPLYSDVFECMLQTTPSFRQKLAQDLNCRLN